MNENEIILEKLLKIEGEVFEYILEDGEELSLLEIKVLNASGYVYHSEQLDIDFETEDGQFNYMNIYYFSKADENIHINQCPQ